MYGVGITTRERDIVLLLLLFNLIFGFLRLNFLNPLIVNCIFLLSLASDLLRECYFLSVDLMLLVIEGLGLAFGEYGLTSYLFGKEQTVM